ncbi:MAG: hypothetical protein LBQ14_11970 [Treponema sp.]|nr:hypothetical protein [Treponema sp.]
MTKKKAGIIAVILGLTAFVLPGSAQELDGGLNGGGEVPLEEEAGGETIPYYIRTIDFNVIGHTRHFALFYVGEFKKGERITGRTNLEKYIAEKTRILHNQRVLEEVNISYTAGEEDAGGVPVDILVNVKDTWNFIAIPWFEYDSNSGMEITVKARHYNFLGTMSPLRVDVGYKKDDDEDSGDFFVEIDSDIPFTAFGYKWNFNFDNYFAYGEKIQYENTTGIAMDLPVERTTLTFGFEQKFSVNEENEDKYKAEYGEYFEDIWYTSSGLYTQWKIPLGLKIPHFGELTYTPKITEAVNYRPLGNIGYLRTGPETIFKHTLGFGEVNWVENYRKGLDVSLVNTNTFNNYKIKIDNEIEFTATGHLLLAKRFGFSGRFQYRQWFSGPNEDDIYDDAGDVLRGINNNSFSAKYMFSLNLDFPILIKRFDAAKSLYSRHMRVFSFDLHASPFIDMAVVDNSEPMDEDNSYKNFLITGGLELILFPHFMRSIYLRVSAGFNLAYYFQTHYIPAGINRELFIGLGHHY